MFEDLIKPLFRTLKIRKIDESKPFVSLATTGKVHRTNVQINTNFDPIFINKAVKAIKNLKEVLVVEFAKKNEEGHHQVWGV